MKSIQSKIYVKILILTLILSVAEWAIFRADQAPPVRFSGQKKYNPPNLPELMPWRHP